MSANRREEPRSRLLQRGRLVFNGGFTSVDCIVMDISSHGARLRPANWLGLPERLELRLPNMPPRRVELRHRDGDGSIGVRFLDAG